MANSTRTLSFKSVPDHTFKGDAASVWLVVGPDWRKYLKWRITEALRQRWEIAWIGNGDLNEYIAPSGVLTTKNDLRRLFHRWKDEKIGSGRRLLIVEDPQGAGIWTELIGDKEWIDMLASSKTNGYDVLIGTGIPLPNSRLVLENTDWLLVRCSGDDGFLVMTDGSRLANWLDAIGRDIFEDIRIYRKMLEVISKKNKDLAIALTSDADELTNRVFWISRENEDSFSDSIADSSSETSLHLRNSLSAEVPTPGDGGRRSTISNQRLSAKIKTAMTLLQDILDELEPQSI
jgi:hypothetical protein